MFVNLPPLFADLDVGEVLRVLLILVFLLVPLFGGIWKKIVQSAAQQRPPHDGEVLAQPADGAGHRADGVRPGEDVMESMESQIEEFLRRAAKKRPDEMTATQEMPQVQYVDEVEIIDEASSGESVVAHVDKYMDSSDKFDKKIGRLGQRTSIAEESLEERLHEKFDHQLGKLADQRVQTDEPSKTPSQSSQAVDAAPSPGHLVDAAAVRDVATMLQNPNNLRHAIILNEILRRPQI